MERELKVERDNHTKFGDQLGDKILADELDGAMEIKAQKAPPKNLFG